MFRILELRRIAMMIGAAVCSFAAVSGFAIAQNRDVAFEAQQCRTAPDKHDAIAACSAVIARSRDPRALERAYNRRGLAHESLQQFSESVADFSQVIRLNPKIAGYFDSRMRAYKALGSLDLALKDADAAVALAPTYSFVFHGRGGVRSDRSENVLAVQDFTAALAIDPADAAALVDRGRAFMALGRTDAAIRDFSEAHATDAAFTAALRERGLAFASVGRANEARSDLALALAAAPDDDVAATALRALDAGATRPPTRIAESGPSAVERAEAEARQRRLEQQAAADAQEEAGRRLKQERLARAKADAGRAQEDASDFIKANRDDSQLMDHLQRIADLSVAVARPEPAPIERGVALLSAGLAADPVYVAYAERRKAERTREDGRTLSDALTTIKAQRRFLFGEIVQNPTGEATAGFLSFVKQADAVAAAPDLARAKALMGGIAAALAKAKLTDRCETETRAAALESPNQTATAQPKP